jgi:hypothetical protein
VWALGVEGFGYKIHCPVTVFTAELSALRHIAEVTRRLERCLILTDSLSSIKVYIV